VYVKRSLERAIRGIFVSRVTLVEATAQSLDERKLRELFINTKIEANARPTKENLKGETAGNNSPSK